MTEHSVIGASSAHRWFECPGSVAMIKKAPPDPGNEYADQGTAAHWVLEQCLTEKGGIGDPYSYVGEEAPNGFVLGKADCKAVDEALEFIEEEMPKFDFIHTEIRFKIDHLHPGLYGTCDIALVNEDLSSLLIIDYKHGAGNLVHVKENKQLLYYGLGAINYMADKYEGLIDILGWGNVFKKVEVAVIQPRCDHEDGPYRKWEVEGEYLDFFAKLLKDKAKATKSPKAKLSAGKHCKWCPAVAICPQFTTNLQEIARVDFDDVTPDVPLVEELSPEKIEKILTFEAPITAWFKSVRAHAQRMMEHGESIPKHKLVKKKANRKWKDEDEAGNVLLRILDEDVVYEQKIMTPAKAEKALGKVYKGEIDGLYFTPDSGTTVVADTDRRQAIITGDARDDFDAIEGV